MKMNQSLINQLSKRHHWSNPDVADEARNWAWPYSNSWLKFFIGRSSWAENSQRKRIDAFSMKHYCNSSKTQNQSNEIMSRNGFPNHFLAKDFSKTFSDADKQEVNIQTWSSQTWLNLEFCWWLYFRKFSHNCNFYGARTCLFVSHYPEPFVKILISVTI